MNPYGYTGREIETNELYYRARYYVASIQRFLSVDPIGFLAGDFNFYRYLGNSPLNFNDHSGLDPHLNGRVDTNRGASVPLQYSPTIYRWARRKRDYV